MNKRERREQRVLKTLLKFKDYTGAVFYAEDSKDMLDEMVELKRELADNADAMLAAYHKGLADGKEEAKTPF